MQMRVTERNNEVEIRFHGLGARQHAVLAALSGAQAGQEPLVDRSKLESLSVRSRADAMLIRLRTKSGEPLDVTQLYRSLRRTLVEQGRAALAAPLAG